MSNNNDQGFLIFYRQIDGRMQRDPQLFLAEFSGTEAISAPFSFELGIFSTNRNIDYGDIIGQNAAVSILLATGEKRYFNGIISRFAQVSGGEEREEGESVRQMSYYTATMVPWLWLLTRYVNSRIFQNKTAPQIVEQIFTDRGFTDYEFRSSDNNYASRVYCAQYRETDFSFISRLLEEEGIFYFFEHEQTRHNLILGDSPELHQACPNQESAGYGVRSFDSEEEDIITSFQKMQEIRFGKWTLRDFNFELTTSPMIEVSEPADEKGKGSKFTLGPGEREFYDYPGLYSDRDSGTRLAKIRLQEEEARTTNITGSSFCRAFAAGTKVRVTSGDFASGHPLQLREDLDDKDYTLVSVSHMGSQTIGPSGPTGRGEAINYANSFTCIPFDTNVPFRPLRITPKPVVQGTQTAVVVGQRGQENEEIYTNEHGQVKVKFHWDRSDQQAKQQSDKKSDHSCWVRVAQLWAGPSWGGLFIPRIGQEVIVDFLEGDPDRPIIIGCVYNADNTPPFEVKSSQGKISGIKSNTTKGGGGYNEISMNDTKGEEGITIHGQKNMNTTIQNDQSVTLKSGNRTITVETGSCTETIEQDLSFTSKSGALNLHGKGKGVSITGDAKGVTITGTPDAVFDAKTELKATGGSKLTLQVGGSNVTLEAAKITLSQGGSQIVLDPSGVTVKGPLVKIN